MWKLAVGLGRRSSLLKFSRVEFPSQVPFNRIPCVSSSISPHFQSCLQNPTFCSHVSATPCDLGSVASTEVHSDSPTCDDIDAASNDALSGPDENPTFVSIEPEHSSVVLGENLENDDAQMGGFVGGHEELEYEIDVGKLEDVLSLLQSRVDGPIESGLEEMSLDLHEEFVVRVIQTPLVPGKNLIGFLLWAKTKKEFMETTRVVDALVRAISGRLKMKEAYSLWDLVQDIARSKNGVLTTASLNHLIALFSKLGKGKMGLEVFDKFGEFGCLPNAESYYFAIEGLCRRSCFDEAWSVCEKMLSAGSLPDDEEIGKIITWFCKGRKAKEAHLVYLFAKGKNKHLPRFSLDLLIGSLCRVDDSVDLAVEMLGDISGDAQKYAIKQYSSVIDALCRFKDVEGAKQLFLKMIDAGPPPGNAVFNSVINCLSKTGNLEEAKEMLKLMESRGLKPDVYTYSVIMSGYAKGGEMEEASKILSEAKKKHSKLSPVTYHILIRGYCKLEDFDQALKVLGEMKTHGVQPNADEYNKLIQSLCLKGLDWGKAEKLLDEMKADGLYLNAITQGLIRAVKELEEEGFDTGKVSVAA